MSSEVIDSLLKEKVKILFKDGNSVRCLRGILLSHDSNFVKLKTLKNEFLINCSEIVKIQHCISDRHENI